MQADTFDVNNVGAEKRCALPSMSRFTPDPAQHVAGPMRVNPLRVPAPRLYIYFDAIARYGSIRGAADAMRIASSALNRRLLDLEASVGTPLFERLQTGVRLTQPGTLFAAHVRRTLADLNAVEGAMLSMQGLVSGQVAIGAVDGAAISSLPSVLANWQSEFPGARIDLRVGPGARLLTELAQNRLELVLYDRLREAEPASSPTIILAQAPTPIMAVMRRGHALAGQQRVALTDCLPFGLVLEDASPVRLAMDAILIGTGDRGSPIFVCNTAEARCRYLNSSSAIGFQARLLLGCDGADDGLVAIPLMSPGMPEIERVLVARTDRALSPGAHSLAIRLRRLIAGV